MEVEGYARPFKDAKLFPGGAREWDWNETGTNHSPGVQPADVDDLLAHGATVIVLSQGMLGRLRIRPETLETLQRKSIAVHVMRTPRAVQIYNELREKERVGGLFHSTC